MLSLISPQGSMKSTALKTLCPDPEWFHDSFSLSVDAKQIIEQSCGKMLVEVADLKGYGTKDTEHIKAILSSSVDTARLAYGRETQEVPRQFIFAATTNVDAFLRDPTGSRRFWPVEVGVFDIIRLTEDRDQLWAEAAAMEAAGGSIRLPPELWAAAGQVQDARTIDDPFFDALEALLGPEEEGKVTNQMIWEKLDILLDRQNNWALGAAMQKLKFGKRKLHTGNGQEKLNGWCRPANIAIPKALKWFFKDPSGEHQHEGDQF
jgi:predicted P-loop ATPase